MKYVSRQCGSFIIYLLANIWNKPGKNKTKKQKMFIALWFGGALADVIEGMCCMLIYSD